jgi:hypothetical protein
MNSSCMGRSTREQSRHESTGDTHKVRTSIESTPVCFKVKQLYLSQHSFSSCTTVRDSEPHLHLKRVCPKTRQSQMRTVASSPIM